MLSKILFIINIHLRCFIVNKFEISCPFRLFGQDDNKEKYALIQLDFLHVKHFNHHLLVSDNVDGLMMGAKEFRKLF